MTSLSLVPIQFGKANLFLGPSTWRNLLNGPIYIYNILGNIIKSLSSNLTKWPGAPHKYFRQQHFVLGPLKLLPRSTSSSMESEWHHISMEEMLLEKSFPTSSNRGLVLLFVVSISCSRYLWFHLLICIIWNPDYLSTHLFCSSSLLTRFQLLKPGLIPLQILCF